MSGEENGDLGEHSPFQTQETRLHCVPCGWEHYYAEGTMFLWRFCPLEQVTAYLDPCCGK